MKNKARLKLLQQFLDADTDRIVFNQSLAKKLHMDKKSWLVFVQESLPFSVSCAFTEAPQRLLPQYPLEGEVWFNAANGCYFEYRRNRWNGGGLWVDYLNTIIPPEHDSFPNISSWVSKSLKGIWFANGNSYYFQLKEDASLFQLFWETPDAA